MEGGNECQIPAPPASKEASFKKSLRVAIVEFYIQRFSGKINFLILKF